MKYGIMVLCLQYNVSTNKESYSSFPIKSHSNPVFEFSRSNFVKARNLIYIVPQKTEKETKTLIANGYNCCDAYEQYGSES